MKRLLKVGALHFVACVFFWSWMGAVALGLGFKDRSAWSTWDHAQNAVVPAVALTLTFPGRLLLENGGTAWRLPVWLGNSLLWSAVLLGVTKIARNRRNRRIKVR